MKPNSLIICAAFVLAMPTVLPAQSGELFTYKRRGDPRAEPGMLGYQVKPFKRGKSGITCYNIAGRPYTWTGGSRCPIS